MLTLIKRIHPRGAARLAAGLVLGAALVAAGTDTHGRQMFTPERDLLNRLMQAGQNDAAHKAFVAGRDQLNAQKWGVAAQTFDKFLQDYPSDKNADAALYWLAYAQEKQRKYGEADAALVKLIKEHSKSEWKMDAEKLRLSIRTKLSTVIKLDGELFDPQAAQRPDADCELKVIALQSLCQADRTRCSAHVNDTLRSNTTCTVLKEAAIGYLGRYGGLEAVPSLIQMSRSEPNEKLRMRAIVALGRTGDERGLEVLRELAMSPVYENESPTDSALHALAAHENPRATAILADAVISGKNNEARSHGAQLLSGRRGDDVTDQLFRIYDGVSEVEVKKYVLAGLGNRKDPRAVARLIEVARNAPNKELRMQAIHSIPNRNAEQDLDVLVSLYDAEREEDLKNHILDAIGHYQHRRAYQKLMQVVNNKSEATDRRKKAVSLLSKSKDPEVLAFLENMLK
jgi:HEAT repeat protein